MVPIVPGMCYYQYGAEVGRGRQQEPEVHADHG